VELQLAGEDISVAFGDEIGWKIDADESGEFGEGGESIRIKVGKVV